MSTTLVKGASWLVAWDVGQKSHVYLRDVDLAFQGNAITYIGPSYEGEATATIDARDRLVLPGLVNIHSHPTSEPGNKGLLEELGSPALGMSSLYEYMPIFRLGPEAATAATEVAVAELLASGVTTFVDLSGNRPGWADDLAATGIRAVLGPMFRSASWTTQNGHAVEYSWDTAAGMKGLDQAVDVVRRARQHPSGRIDAMLAPAQIDTCDAALLEASRDAARELGVPLQIHAAQSVVEFQEITRRHGKTPIQFLESLGVLGPSTIIGHGIFINDHPWLHWPETDDLRRLADAGASLAHCPNVFVRRGIVLNHLHRYIAAGVNVGIGTDTFPHNMLEEMRWAATLARVMAGDYRGASTAEVFTAATVGGARALGRDDIGRLAVGAKADLVLVDLAHPAMRPVREPLRSLIYSACERAIQDVYVDGAQVVRGGRVLTIDIEAAHAKLAEAQARALAGAQARDWAGRTVEEMSPMVFPMGRAPGR
ncbi:MAG: amidohydrolase family protein [Proteobacteria bacterium]|nr:amidohydrolase family protein [Pseudomonadota bacterium]MBI3497544.1 amidohydrolase family protein [Pseudomonadota bacterium]